VRKHCPLFLPYTLMMNDRIKILKANLNDTTALSVIAATTFYDTYGAYNKQETIQRYIDKWFSTSQMCKELSDDRIIYYLVYDQQQLSGYIKLQFVNPHQNSDLNGVELSRLYLLKQWHGSGVSEVMLNHCYKIAEELKQDAIWLSVWEKNNRAIRFYEKHGFVKKGNLIFKMDDEDQNDFLMVKHLI